MERASELMTAEVVAVPVTGTVRDALRVLEELDVRHAPVVDEQRELVGIVSDRDLAPLHERPRALELRIADVMSADVVAVEPEADLVELIDLLVEHRIGALPVVDHENHLLGIVSAVDVLRAVAKELVWEERGLPARRRRGGDAAAVARDAL